MSIGWFILYIKGSQAIRTSSAYSVESDLWCTSRIDFDNVTLMQTMKIQMKCCRMLIKWALDGSFYISKGHRQSELPLPIPWNRTSDVHRGSTLIMWRWRYITWRWHHRNHANTIISIIEAKQTVINEFYIFHLNIAIVMFYWKIHKLHLFCWLNFLGNQKNGF